VAPIIAFAGRSVNRRSFTPQNLHRQSLSFALFWGIIDGLWATDLTSPAGAQQPAPASQVEALLASMSIEERVGQLFLVTFVGDQVAPGSDIARLIRQDHVGGVVLLAANSNLSNDANTPRRVAELTNALQALALTDGAQIPLFIAVDHEGDGYPYTRITGGTTPLPNAMAIGATWSVDQARAVGQITGLELVGQMGRAYIAGVHQGSGGRVATVAKHFPGHGGSDRLPDEEVATVDKSVAELVQTELAPFLAVTQAEGDEAAVTDALMSSHIRRRPSALTAGPWTPCSSCQDWLPGAGRA